MKTCWEVFQYMNHFDAKISGQAGDAANSLVEGYSKVDFNGPRFHSFRDITLY